jgi:hypothetical protein
MQLLSNEILRKLLALCSQENQKDPLVVCKFFDPAGSWTWHAWEGSPVDEHGYYDTDKEKVDFLFFGLVIVLRRNLVTFPRASWLMQSKA